MVVYSILLVDLSPTFYFYPSPYSCMVRFYYYRHQYYPLTVFKERVRPSFMGIVFGSGILLDLVLFANRIIAEPKS